MIRTLVLAQAALLLGACSVLDRLVDEERYTNDSAKTMIPGKSLYLSPNVSFSYENIVFWGAYAGIAYAVLDPLAPNWAIEQAAFPDQHVLISMKMKRFYAGGAGEARQVFQRRAGELMRSGGFNGYQIVEYSEGLDSSVLGSQRVARGVVKLTHSDEG